MQSDEVPPAENRGRGDADAGQQAQLHADINKGLGKEHNGNAAAHQVAAVIPGTQAGLTYPQNQYR